MICLCSYFRGICHLYQCHSVCYKTSLSWVCLNVWWWENINLQLLEKFTFVYFSHLTTLREWFFAGIKFCEVRGFCSILQKLVPAKIISKLSIRKIQKFNSSKSCTFSIMKIVSLISLVNTFFNLIQKIR